ncbi:hypothetical protein [Bacillus thuringiensis]|uniref:Uncharacterized protein n=1 Tax=Bacillus thuringiensis serovar andalousiensis TaxID=257985 RepID=A0A6H0TF55_BACTU|nr:hypothetical protein [Bacillus thuringiensis]QIW18314.1 hypothetical protein EVG22_07495 [Bacillus thuringiensis serovar andalousiensis]
MSEILNNWELLGKYETQGEAAHEMQKRYRQKVEAAKERVVEATVKYEVILQKEFSGESVVAEKKKALADIDVANAAVKIAKDELNKAYDYSNKYIRGKVTLKDLADDFRMNIAPQIREKEVQPIVDRAERALYAYYEALAEFHSKRAAIKQATDWFSERAIKQRPYPGALINPADSREFPRPTEQVLSQIERLHYVPEDFNGVEGFILDRLAKIHS